MSHVSPWKAEFVSNPSVVRLACKRRSQCTVLTSHHLEVLVYQVVEHVLAAVGPNLQGTVGAQGTRQLRAKAEG